MMRTKLLTLNFPIMRKLIYILIGLFSATFTLSAQHCNKWYLDGNYQFLMPLGEFKDGGFSNAHGASMAVYYDLNPTNTNLNLHLGLRLNALLANGYKGTTTLIEPAGAAADIKIYNALVDFKFVGRVIFKPASVMSFYIDGGVGLRINASHEKYNLNTPVNGFEESSSEQVNSKLSPVFGLSIGALYKISDRVDLDFRISGDYSTHAEYIDMNSVLSSLTYQYSNTNALNLSLHLGFRVRIGCENNQQRNKTQRRSSSSLQKGKKLKRTSSKPSGGC